MVEQIPDPQQEQAAEFLSRLFAPYPDGWIELRATRVSGQGMEQAWFDLAGMAPIERAASQAMAWSHEGRNVYTGVLPRSIRGNGKKESVQVAGWVWADIDFKNTPPAQAQDVLRQQQPDMVVLTGGGLHVYWELDKVLVLDKRTRTVFEGALAAKIRELGADPAAKDVSRVLRVPGTVNTKYDPPRLVEMLPTFGELAHEEPILAAPNPAEELRYWLYVSAHARSTPEGVYAAHNAWIANARLHGDERAAQRHERDLNAWLDKGRKAGLAMYSRLYTTEIRVIESARWLPPGEPVVFTRSEMEMLRGQAPEAIRAAWEMKRDFGGLYTGPVQEATCQSA